MAASAAAAGMARLEPPGIAGMDAARALVAGMPATGA